MVQVVTTDLGGDELAASRPGHLVSIPFTWKSGCTQGRSDITYLTNSFRTVLCTSLSTMVRLGHADTNIFQTSDIPSYWEPSC